MDPFAAGFNDLNPDQLRAECAKLSRDNQQLEFDQESFEEEISDLKSGKESLESENKTLLKQIEQLTSNNSSLRDPLLSEKWCSGSTSSQHESQIDPQLLEISGAAQIILPSLAGLQPEVLESSENHLYPYTTSAQGFEDSQSLSSTAEQTEGSFSSYSSFLGVQSEFGPGEFGSGKFGSGEAPGGNDGYTSSPQQMDVDNSNFGSSQAQFLDDSVLDSIGQMADVMLLKNQLAESQQKCEYQSNQLKDAQRCIDSWRGNSERLLEDLNTSNKNCQTNMGDYHAEQAVSESLRNDYSKLEQKYSQLQGELESSRTEIAEQNRQNDEAVQKAQALQRDLFVETETVGILRNHIQGLEKTGDNLRNNLQNANQLRSRINELEQQNGELQEQLKDTAQFQDQSSELEQRNQNLQLDSENPEMSQNAVSELEEVIEDVLSSSSTTTDDLKIRIAELEREKEETTLHSSSIILTLRKQISGSKPPPMRLTPSHVHKINKGLVRQMRTQENEKNALIEKNDKKAKAQKAKMEGLLIKHEQEREAMKRQLKADVEHARELGPRPVVRAVLEGEIKSLKKVVGEKMKEIEQMKRKERKDGVIIENLQEDYYQAQEKLVDLASLQAKCASQDGEIEHLKILNRRKAEMEKEREASDVLARKAADLQSSLDGARKQADKFKSATSLAEKNLVKMESKLEEKEKVMRELHTTLECKEIEVDEHKDNLHQLRKQASEKDVELGKAKQNLKVATEHNQILQEKVETLERTNYGSTFKLHCTITDLTAKVAECEEKIASQSAIISSLETEASGDNKDLTDQTVGESSEYIKAPHLNSSTVESGGGNQSINCGDDGHDMVAEGSSAAEQNAKRKRYRKRPARKSKEGQALEQSKTDQGSDSEKVEHTDSQIPTSQISTDDQLASAAENSEKDVSSSYKFKTFSQETTDEELQEALTIMAETGGPRNMLVNGQIVPIESDDSIEPAAPIMQEPQAPLTPEKYTIHKIPHITNSNHGTSEATAGTYLIAGGINTHTNSSRGWLRNLLFGLICFTLGGLFIPHAAMLVGNFISSFGAENFDGSNGGGSLLTISDTPFYKVQNLPLNVPFIENSTVPAMLTVFQTPPIIVAGSAKKSSLQQIEDVFHSVPTVCLAKDHSLYSKSSMSPLSTEFMRIALPTSSPKENIKEIVPSESPFVSMIEDQVTETIATPLPTKAHVEQLTTATAVSLPSSFLSFHEILAMQSPVTLGVAFGSVCMVFLGVCAQFGVHHLLGF